MPNAYNSSSAVDSLLSVTSIGELRDAIQHRIRQLEADASRLQAALSALDREEHAGARAARDVSRENSQRSRQRRAAGRDATHHAVLDTLAEGAAMTARDATENRAISGAERAVRDLRSELAAGLRTTGR